MSDERPYIELADGSKWFPGALNPRTAPSVLAHSTGNLCRFTGHCRYFYSVAEHLVRCSYMVPPEFALEALIHDSHEALVNDLSKPVKIFIAGSYGELENSAEAELRSHYGLPEHISPEVKRADIMMCMIEAFVLMPSRGERWGGPYGEMRAEALALLQSQSFRLHPQGWGPTLNGQYDRLILGQAATRWMMRFSELTGEQIDLRHPLEIPSLNQSPRFEEAEVEGTELAPHHSYRSSLLHSPARD